MIHDLLIVPIAIIIFCSCFWFYTEIWFCWVSCNLVTDIDFYWI